MAIPNITIAPPVHKVKIEPVSGFVFNPATVSHGFIPSPTNPVLLTAAGVSNTALTTEIPPATLGGIVMQPAINVEVGSSTDSIVPQLLNSFKYDFPNWTSNNTALTSANFPTASVVYIENTGNNTYGCSLERASTDNLDTGAKHNLFLFLSYSNFTLKVLHKGYYDVPNQLMDNWAAGKTIYLNENGRLDTSPSSTSGHWVRSLGFCIPNVQNKKRVWFEPDTTYLKII